MKATHVLLSLLLACLCQVAAAADPVADFKAALPAFRLDEQRTAAIDRFASLAKANDIEGMLAMLVPAARAAEGDELMREWLSKEVAPFFASFERLHTYRNIEPRVMPDNSVGYRYYTYFIGPSGAEVPFDIILMEVGGTTMVANFNARGCIKGKHPVCK